MNEPGATVFVSQMTSDQLLHAVKYALDVKREIIGVYKITEMKLQDFMESQDQKNYCWTCQEFLQNDDHAERCDEQDHQLLWKDPRSSR